MAFERKEDQNSGISWELILEVAFERNSGIRWKGRLEVALYGKEDQKGDI